RRPPRPRARQLGRPEIALSRAVRLPGGPAPADRGGGGPHAVTKPRRRPSVPGARSTAAGPSADALRKTDAMILRIALGSITLYALYWLYRAFTIHHIGNYGVETDFYWKYGPAAAALQKGRVLIEHFDSQGWG